ncbi:SpoIIE family protein phosphatase [Streptomyces sp. NPDC050743]|uniref:ATP-binding SpoIIE family protein phosphatase n=1 Tax=Streptomyces sp. NPDC050743 TaxID=3365634 RepID=UPI00378F7A5D
MNVSSPHAGDGPFALDSLTAAVLDGQGVVLRWTAAAAELTGLTAEEVCGRPVHDLLADVPGELCTATGMPASGRVRLRHRSGDTIDVAFRATRVEGLEGSTEFLVLASPTQCVTDHEQGVALLRALSSQDRIGMALHDMDLTIVRSNALSGNFRGPLVQPGSRLRDVLSAEDAESVEGVLRQVLETGVPVVRRAQEVSLRQAPAARKRALSLSAFRLENARGCPTGVAALFIDTTEELRAFRHLNLAREVTERVGRSLDVERTAQELTDVLVPALGDLAAVDLAHAVFDGDEPPKWLGGGDLHLRNAAMAPADAPWPAGIQRGDPLPPLRDHPVLRRWQRGKTLILSRDDYIAALGDPWLVEFLLPKGSHSLMLAPLYARGLMLGNVTAARVRPSDPFTGEDADLMTQIASRAALAIDNARRYTREHRAAVALQRRLLPPATTDTPAAETAGVYLPAGGGAEIGGDWFDAIPLPSLRVAFVAGDVVGHGMPATATMGRLRAAIQTLADLELEPEELLTRMADLVQRLAAEAPPDTQDTVGATCLYAVYDPVARCCTMASAGHPPPVLVRPDGTAQVVRISPGPPLAVGGMPYEATTIDLEPGSTLALYTDGLIEQDDRDVDQGLRRLTDALAVSCRPGRALEDAGRAILAGLGDQSPRDDVALLLARTRAVPAEDTAQLALPADPAAVSVAREWADRQLAGWGLDDLLFTTELIVSELVTNAVRYARPPLSLHLIRHDVLVCEVTDASSTQPRLRRARTTDEGGRGLFIVAQLTTRWGCRYSQDRKTIWSEQPIKSSPEFWPVAGESLPWLATM